MSDRDCVAFLQWGLPRLGLRWPGFRRVRRQVCRRLNKRLAVLGLADLDAYRRHLRVEAGEWAAFDGLCRITVSRFYRDREVFDHLRRRVLPALARDAREAGRPLRCWCAGCASGEEAYTLSILWHLGPGRRFPDLRLEVVATDAEPVVLARARAGLYGGGGLKDLPAAWRRVAFVRDGEAWRLRDRFRADVVFRRQDVRRRRPRGPFDLVLCRNLAFTYFDAAGQDAVGAAIAARLGPGGVLVVGADERPPDGLGLTPEARRPFHRKAADA